VQHCEFIQKHPNTEKGTKSKHGIETRIRQGAKKQQKLLFKDYNKPLVGITMSFFTD